MADQSLTIFEKYPNSWRLDHPDFGDVCKTTFAKGVITDFEKTSEAPLRVKSMVKVNGGWGESDFIPLFYHPKKNYWDDLSGSPLATDFNQEKRFFERAWMSFRCGDEVTVMLKEGIPIYVLGFADGKPKIGEDILKLAAIPDLSQSDLYYSMASGIIGVSSIDSSEIGPDGLPLKLTTEAQFIEGGSGDKLISSWYDTGSEYGPCQSEQNPLPPFNEWTYLYYYKEDGSLMLKVCAWIVIIGPLLYVYVSLYSNSKTEANLYVYGSETFIQAVSDWCIAMASDPNMHDVPPPVSGSPSEEPTINTGEFFSLVGGMLKAGIYTEELLEAVISAIGGISPIYAYDNIGDDWWPNAPAELIFQGGGGLIPDTPPENVKLYYRPHN